MIYQGNLRLLSSMALITGISLAAFAQAPTPIDPAKDKERGSLVEDRAAKKLLEAGDARVEAQEFTKAVEIWQSVIERYPRSKVRFEAHMRLGTHFLDRERAYDRARTHFEAAGAEINTEEAMRADATLKMGICFYEVRNYGKSFRVMRDVIERYPVSPQVNQAYYYIGLGHFQLGHYSRAISALEKVGTVLGGDEGKIEKVEAGKRLFVKIEDADLAALEQGKSVKVKAQTTQGDEEIVECYPLGRNVRVVLGSILTTLGKPKKGNGRLEVRGDDKVKVTYIDQHTADRKFDRPVLKDVAVVGNAVVEITDGAFKETLKGVVLGKTINLQITDADMDLTDQADKIQAIIGVYREKSPMELEAEGVTGTNPALKDADKVDRFKKIDAVPLTLIEAKVNRTIAAMPGKEDADEPAPKPKEEPKQDNQQKSEEKPKEPAKPADQQTKEEKKPIAPVVEEKDDGTIHSGVFRASLSLVMSEKVIPNDDQLQAMPGDLIRVTYLDERNSTAGKRTVKAEARTVEGSLGGVRVTRAQITDQELRVKTQLKTASALTNIGNRYKEFGLKQNAETKYGQALKICEEIGEEAQKLGGRILEETYVQLWKIYFEMDKLELAAAMSQRLQREFPNSEFVDAALLQLAQVAKKQNNLQRAIGIYASLLQMEKSQLRGEAQFGIAECYEDMAKAAEGAGGAQLFDRAFQEYKKVFDNFPESGRVGEAVAKMANYYYQQKDYRRAVDVFESVLSSHPDAKYLDVILFNYGRCLYRMDRKGDARKQFDQLIQDFPESPLAPDAKKISEALNKTGT